LVAAVSTTYFLGGAAETSTDAINKPATATAVKRYFILKLINA
jgi:hypothetical protein